MKQQSPESMLDRLTSLARDQQPPDLEQDKAADLVRMAMKRAQEEPSRQHGGTHWKTYFAVAAALIPLFVVGGYLINARLIDNAAPTNTLLPSGDRLVAAPGAQYQVESMSEDHRQVSLDRGIVLFDVEPLENNERFQVVTEHLQIEVRGTVFSVESDAEGTIVRVYEGRVEINQGSHNQLIGARRMWVSHRRRDVPLEFGPLSNPGLEAARRRESLAETNSVNEPTQPPTVESSEAETTEPSEIIEPTQTTEGQEDSEATPPGPFPETEANTVSGQPVIAELDPPVRNETRPVREAVGLDRPIPSAGSTTSDTGSLTPDGGQATESEEPSEEPAETPAAFDPSQVTLAEARRLLMRGRTDQVIAAARAHSGGSWRMMEGDALRASRRFTQAARAYDQALSELSGGQACQAGYLAAFIHFRHLGNASSGLSSLNRSRADNPSCPLAERALALRVRMLRQMGRTGEARNSARMYLERYPHGGMSEYMEALVNSGQQSSETSHD